MHTTLTRDLQPPPAGEKRKRESWETIYYWGMFGSMGVATVLLYIKPDTSCVISCSFIAKETQIFAQDTNMGFEGSQGAHGGSWRLAPIRAQRGCCSRSFFTIMNI